MKPAPKTAVVVAIAVVAAGIGFSFVSLPAHARGGRMGGFTPPNNDPNNPSGQSQNKSGGLTQTVTKDELTSAESDGLKAQQDALQKASDGLTGDDTLTKDECDTLQGTIDSASFFIWSKGADDDGKVATRYGTSIFPVEALTKTIEGHTITRPQARTVLTALRTLAAAKLRLSSEDLTPTDRAALQKQFNAGLAKYYMVK